MSKKPSPRNNGVPIYFHIDIYKGRMTTDNIKQQLQTIMETTPEEDKQYLNEVKEEIKKKDQLEDHGYIQ